GKRSEAIACYRRGLENKPDHVESLLNIGVLLAEQGQVDEAIGFWQRALRLRPDHAQAHHNLGVALAQKGQYDEAVRSLERALELKPDYAEACYNLANVKSQWSVVSGQWSVVSGRGTAGGEQDRRGEAVRLLQRAVSIRPGYIEAYHNLGSALTELGRPGEAEVWLRQAVRLCERSGAGSGDPRTTRSPTSDLCPPTSGSDLCPLTSSSLTSSCYNQLG